MQRCDGSLRLREWLFSAYTGGRREICRKIAGSGIFLINSWAGGNAFMVDGFVSEL